MKENEENQEYKSDLVKLLDKYVKEFNNDPEFLAAYDEYYTKVHSLNRGFCLGVRIVIRNLISELRRDNFNESIINKCETIRDETLKRYDVFESVDDPKRFR